MKLEDCRKAYYTYTTSVSSIARQLGFAGIAVIWIFRTDRGGAYQIPPELILPGLLLVCSLSADFLHYLIASFVWGIFNRIKEKQGMENEVEFQAPDWINWPGNVFFYTKILLIFASYIYLIMFLYNELIIS